MDLVERTINLIETNRERIITGKINCIPSPLENFTDDFPGVEQGTYYLVSGGAKASKSKFTNFIFLFNTILYVYDNPGMIRLKIFYALLEEKEVNIMLKFMSYVLATRCKTRVDIKTLKSIKRSRFASGELVSLIKSEEMMRIWHFFKDHITWIPDRNPTGIWNVLDKYAKDHGTIYTKIEEGFDKPKFDYYVPDDPDEYVLCIIDHIGLISTELQLDLRLSIKKLSEYLKIARNHYNYTPVVVQQQNSKTLSLDAFKADKVFPNQDGLLDCQDTSRDCDIFIGIVSPHAFDYKDFDGFNIEKLKGYGRWIKIVQGRDGEDGGSIGLYYDGATGFYYPLPRRDDILHVNEVYKLVEQRRKERFNRSPLSQQSNFFSNESVSDGTDIFAITNN